MRLPLVAACALAACQGETRPTPGGAARASGAPRASAAPRSVPAASPSLRIGAPRPHELTAPVGPVPPAVARCQLGLERIPKKVRSLDEALATFRRECANVHGQPGCRAAWNAAAKVPGPQQTALVVQGCRAVYCAMPAIAASAACRAGPDAAAIERAWPVLQSAIWQHEIGGWAGVLERRLVVSFNEAGELWPQGKAK